VAISDTAAHKSKHVRGAKSTICSLYVSVHEEEGEVLCAYYDEDDCRFAYVYTYSDNNTLIVRAQEERECPPEIHVLGMYLSVFMP
jgi:hypothetical protein